jgi:hypothetical protein
MKANLVEHAPPNVPSTLDRASSLVDNRLTMWVLGVALLVICLVGSSVLLALPV